MRPGNPLLRLCLLVASFMTAAAAQEPRATIRVEVTSSSGPVSGATVTVNSQTLRTGAEGTAIATIPPGEVKIAVSKEGFFPATTSVAATEPREWVVRVELQASETVEEEVHVFATRNDVRIQDSPLHVEVLPREEVEEKMLMTPGDIVMMLNEMGGMRVQTTSPSLGAASVRVQGMRGRYTAFLSDGLPLFGQQGAGLGLLQIPPMDLGQVEVIKGNSSALYGSGAMAGVVNLISRRPAAEPVHEFLVNRSTLGATDATMFLAMPVSEHWSASLLGGGHSQEHRDLNGDGWTDLAGYGRGIVRPRFYWDDKRGHTALLTGGITYEDRSGGTADSRVLSATGNPYREALDTRRFDFGGNVQWLLAGSYVVNGRFSVTEQRHRHQFGETIENDRHELVFGELSVKGSHGRHTWVAGTAAQRDGYRPLDVRRFAYVFVVPGVFVQDDVTLAPWLSVFHEKACLCQRRAAKKMPEFCSGRIADQREAHYTCIRLLHRKGLAFPPFFVSASRSRFHPHSGLTASGAHWVPFEYGCCHLSDELAVQDAERSHPDSAVCGHTANFLRCYYRFLGIVQRFIYFPTHPQPVQQYRQLSSHCHHRPLLCSSRPVLLRQLQTPSPQIAVFSKRSDDVVCTVHQQSPQSFIAGLRDSQLRILLSRLPLLRPQTHITAHVPASFKPKRVANRQPERQRR